MKKIAILSSLSVIVILLWILTPQRVHAAPITDVPVTVTQPDGAILHLFASGDEYYNWLHDADGYTIMQDPVTGYYVYADLVNGELAPTQFIVGKTDPASKGLRPFTNIAPAQKEDIRQAFLDQTYKMAGEISNAPRSGTITNLVVFIRFSGESEFTDLTSKYTDVLNNATPGANSLRNYYQEVSYNALTIDSALFPTPGATIVSYQDSHPRGYYRPYHAVTNPIGYTNDRGLREHTLLRDAINYVNGLGQFPNGASIDGDGDGIVDSLTFIVRGDTDGWSQLLWPHAWSLYTYTVTINGKKVAGYQFQLQTTTSNGILAHEMFHVLGAPDLYHYSSSGNPVGTWDVMGYQTNPPAHMGCYMKYKYGGWISSLPELPFTTAATYSLNPLTSATDNCKKIASPYSTTEFFVVEYRNKGTGSVFESSLRGSGLLVYRINTLAHGNGSGPPDEVYIYRPWGTISSTGDIGYANFSSAVGRTAINDSTNPSSFLSNGDPGGLNLCNIGAPDATISFGVCLSSHYTISGNAGVGGATLSYIDGTLKTVAAKGNGDYSLEVPAGWYGTVTASKAGFTFSPVSRSYTNVLLNQMVQNYTASGPPNLIQDPGFEAFVPGTPHPNWTGTSINFGTPLCTTVSYCLSSAAKPQTGSAWGRFGHAAGDELASLSQTIHIPSGTALLEFYLWIGYAENTSDAADLFTVTIDGVPVFSANATQIASYPTYTFVSVDVSAYADDATHTILFLSDTTDQFVVFNLDDVALYSLLAPPGAFDRTSPANGATDQSTSPTLHWGTSTGAASYEYCFDTTNDNTCSNWVSNGASTSKALNGLDQNTPYYWHVRARNPSATTYANGSATVFWSFRTGSAPGAFNKSLPANGVIGQPTSLTLSWGSSSGATSYEYCYDTTDDQSCSNWTNSGMSTSVQLSGLSQSTTYFWQVRANNAFSATYANGSTTAFWSISTGGAPGVFRKASPSNGATNQPTSVTLQWDSSNGAGFYEFCYDQTDDDVCSPWIKNGSSTSKTLSGLDQNTTYYWHVRAVNSFGTTYANGASIAFWSFTTQPAPVTPPGAFNKSAPANGATNQSIDPTLSWGTSSGATTYYYCYDTTNDNACSNWTNNGASTYGNLSGLSYSTTYYWHVRATNSSGTTYANGSTTAFWSFTTQMEADDNYEENDTLGAAYDLSAREQQWLNTINGYGIQADEDWYRIYVSSGFNRVKIDARFTDSQGDIDIALYNSSGTRLASSTSITDNEYIDYTVPSAGGYYYIRVYYGNQGNQYNLWWDDVQPLPALGPDTTGVFRPSNGLLYLKNQNTTGYADVAINYGLGGDYPVTGDWDGDGDDTIGIYRNGSFYLRNSNTIGFANLVFPFGAPGDQPIAGDWNGDGVDTIGVYRPSTGLFMLRNSNSAGAADVSFYLGNVGDVGIAGDWNGNGVDTTGVFRPSNGALYLKNTNATGFADIQINYGLPGDKPVTGDWDGDGDDTIGIYRNGSFYLRNSNTIGFADLVFDLGVPGDMPIAGDWDGAP